MGDDVSSIKEFSSELIVEAVVRCVRVIDPGLGGALPTSLPPGMSARFRVGMSLAQACQVRLRKHLTRRVFNMILSQTPTFLELVWFDINPSLR